MDDVQMHVMFLDLHSDFDATPNQNSVSVVGINFFGSKQP